MDQTVQVGIPTHEMLARLPIPERLSDAQQQGHVCVWGGESLTAQTAIDLGSRPATGGRMLFPRSCRVCLAKAAMQALVAHTMSLDACTECQVSSCDVGQALNRIIREAHR